MNDYIEKEQVDSDEYTEEEIDEFNFEDKVKTNIEDLITEYDATEIKSSDISRHYVIKNKMDKWFYLKIWFFNDSEEFKYCLDYFKQLKEYFDKVASQREDVIQIIEV